MTRAVTCWTNQLSIILRTLQQLYIYVYLQTLLKLVRRMMQTTDIFRWFLLIAMVLIHSDGEHAPLIESRLAALIAPARYHLQYDRAILQLHLQLPPSPEELLKTRCHQFYDQLRFHWSHLNQTMKVFSICQRKRQMPRRRKRFAAITALIITSIITAITAVTAVGIAVSNRVAHEQLQHRVVKFEKTVRHTFQSVDDSIDDNLDISEAINARLSKAYVIVQRAFSRIEKRLRQYNGAVYGLIGHTARNEIATQSLWFGSMILQAYTQYGSLYQEYMREIQQVHALSHISMARAPPLLSAKATQFICELYSQHQRYMGFCETENMICDVFITDSRLNSTHFTVDLSIPWGTDDRDAAATVYSLVSLPKQAANNTVDILSLSKRAKALIFDRDTIHAVTDVSSCSRHRNSVFCKKQPDMLLRKDRECASALLMAPLQTDMYCDKLTVPRDCHLSPIYAIFGTVYYFLGGCGNLLKIFNGSTLVNSTAESTLFVLSKGYTVVINATTFLQAPEQFRVHSKLINNRTLMIVPQSTIPMLLNTSTLAETQWNSSLIWSEEALQLDDEAPVIFVILLAAVNDNWCCV